jgi:NitT/TauT family transport system substrate-binding protein
MVLLQSRREFTASLSLAGAAALIGSAPALADAGPPETTTVRFAKAPGICIAPQYVAEEMLRAEGFTDLQYVEAQAGLTATTMVARDELDFSIDFATAFAIPIAAGERVKVLSGIHVGCYELFAHDGIDSIRDLKGRSLGVGPQLGTDAYVFLSVMATHVGLDPATDIDWITSELKPKQLFVEGKIDAFLAFPPEPQELRARKIGHVVVNSALDHPWSQYFCCMLAGNAAYVEKYPVATKRALRAILKGVDLCASEPDMVARRLIEGGYAKDYDYTLQAINEVPYLEWRNFDPEDTIRFFSLRLHEAGLIKSTPQQIIADGTDWRFLSELKRELKG